uniref:Putative ovule protein n=1 Tax=Solanum chacoense TaxID=4108 RepID=A0A0V0IQE5_SOLCH
MSLTLFNQPVKVRFSKIFLLLHNFFDVSSKIGVSKNSKFEFLEPKSTIKGGLRSSFRDDRINRKRDP